MLKRPHSAFISVCAFVLALLASASTWFYFNRVLKPAQVADAAVHNRPRGNLSDLYPRWLGARELLLRGRNPYSQEIMTEIQRGYYGRPLDPSNPYDPKDKQGFAYPVYVVFLLAPTIYLPFDVVQTGFRWLIIALTAASVLCWLRVLRWSPPLWVKILGMVLVLGSVPVVQGIKLQQLSLLVAGLIACCAACLSAGYLLCAGALLALATIKPQLTGPLVLWMLVWAASEWRSRWRFPVSFGMVMILLLGAGELLLPGWWRMFLDGIHHYHEYTQNQSILHELVGSILARIIEGLAVLGCVLCLWPDRRQPASSASFGQAYGLVLALTVLIVPMSALYNEILLLPAILFLLRSATLPRSVSRLTRFIRAGGVLLFVWPWIATMGLSLASFWLTSERRQNIWTLPFYSTFAFPIFIFGLAFLEIWTSQRHTLRVDEPAE